MDRRGFLLATGALIVGSQLPALSVAKLGAELAPGVLYISQSFEKGGIWFVETWYKHGEKIIKQLSTEDAIVSVEEWDFFPFAFVPWTATTWADT